MTTSTIASEVAKNKTFQDRVNYYVLKATIAIMAEANTTGNHVERVAFASKVFISDYNLNQYVDSVLTNSTVLDALDTQAGDNGVSDIDLESTVNSIYNAFSGVSK